MKSLILAVLACILALAALSQNNPPVVVNDTVEVMSQIAVDIDAMANDSDPDGDALLFKDWSDPPHGYADTVGGKFRYKSRNYIGNDYLDYRLVDDGTPPENSMFARIYINITENPHVPFSEYESYNLPELEPAELDILANDTDPEGNALKVNTVYSEENCEVSISDDSLSVIVTPKFASYKAASFYYTSIEKNTTEGYISNSTKVFIKILPNPDIPVLIADTAYTTGGIPYSIPVLENDFDQQGEAFEIFTFTYPSNATVVQDGDNIVVTPNLSFAGKLRFSYRVRENFDPDIYSEYQWVRVYVAKNPACPVGVADQAAGTTMQSVVIDVLPNDYDPQEDPLEIMDVDAEGTAVISDNMITYTSSPLEVGADTIYYRIRQANDNAYYSEWTPIYLDLAANPDLPVAVEDHVTVNSCLPVTISPLLNDIRNSADSLYIVEIEGSTKGAVTLSSDSLVTYQAYSNITGDDIFEYIIMDKNNPDLAAKGKIYIDITDLHYYDSLVINNINAGVLADGILFGNLWQIPVEGLEWDIQGHFKYPAGSQLNTILCSSLWVEGYSPPDSVHYAIETHRISGTDFQPGPVSDTYDENYSAKYWKLWKLNRSDVEYHRDNWQSQAYQPLPDIASWPGNGDIEHGESDRLAPFFDQNADGIYNPMNGDYPMIRGDQCIYFICNDDKEHTESEGGRLRIEVHGMVYAFDAPEDSVLNNTVFVHYDLVNRSGNTYYDTYAGVFTDMDIGYYDDDNTGCDVTRASYYGFNGDNFDDTHDLFGFYEPGYEDSPPALGVTVLAGPFLDPDGSDNPQGDCDFSINGLNFGNGTNDDERLGLCRYMFQASSSGYPYLYPDYFMMMNGYFSDGSRCTYGGTGHYSDPRSTGQECNFMAPGSADPMGWGLGCEAPGWPYDQEGFYWSDSSNYVPGNRSGAGIMGPFTFAPGQVQEIELAYSVTLGSNGPVSSVEKLLVHIDTLRARVNRGEIIVTDEHLGIAEPINPFSKLNVYPNPASDRIFFTIGRSVAMEFEYTIYDISGRIMEAGSIANNNQNILDISRLKPGLYILTIKTEHKIYSGKIIKS